MIPSRRTFLARAAGAGVAWLALDWATVSEALAHAAHAVAQSPPPPFRTLTADEAAELSAVAARILPTTDTPGATEAGVIHFIDRALGAEQQKALATLRRGVADLKRRTARRKAGVTHFAALAPDDQDAILVDIEKGDFFQAMRFLTMVGTFGDPAWGGNRNMIGWKSIGFEHQKSYAPPFGYYDAEAQRGGR
ncbi:MAG TPA: gluconate 2-dehydrogenase subunit 3 family protein [Gemmatimonadaceae bacterium]|nr:gluconate 2-dehydrogenase subunit 3 family protein [Gemmatimonadaceae bacterium]